MQRVLWIDSKLQVAIIGVAVCDDNPANSSLSCNPDLAVHVRLPLGDVGKVHACEFQSGNLPLNALKQGLVPSNKQHLDGIWPACKVSAVNGNLMDILIVRIVNPFLHLVSDGPKDFLEFCFFLDADVDFPRLGGM